MQVKPVRGTGPFDVAGLNVQLTESTSSPVSNIPFSFESWKSWIEADVNDTSVTTSVQFELGQPGAPGTGLTGAAVVVEMVTFPFLMSPAGSAFRPPA